MRETLVVAETVDVPDMIRKEFLEIDFFVCGITELYARDSLPWFWRLVNEFNLLDEHLVEMSRTFLEKLHAERKTAVGVNLWERVPQLKPIIIDMLEAAQKQLNSGKVTVKDVEHLWTNCPSIFDNDVDTKLKQLINNVPHVMGRQILNYYCCGSTSRLYEVGRNSYEALLHVAQ